MSQPKQYPFFQRLSLLMVGVVSVLAFAYAILGNNGYLELRRREAKNQELRLRAEELRRENKEILSEIRALKSDPKAIEKIAREELGMVKTRRSKITTNPARQESTLPNLNSGRLLSPLRHSRKEHHPGGWQPESRGGIQLNGSSSSPCLPCGVPLRFSFKSFLRQPVRLVR
jgi:cell division protein FtsB